MVFLKNKRNIAKAGMTVSIAALFVSGFYRKGYNYKTVHTVSGFALAGFAIWHNTLYVKR